MLVEVPITTIDIIDVLQKYKLCAMKVFRNKVNLWFDREKKEIKFEIPSSSSWYSKKVAYNQLAYKRLNLEELIPYVKLLKLVDEWIEALSARQAEALFWRFINHDIEPYVDKADWRIRYKTLSYEKIAERMSCPSQDVYIYVQRALKMILQLNERTSKKEEKHASTLPSLKIR